MSQVLDTKTDFLDLWSKRPQREKYIASDDLLTATRLAVALGRPLLLRGEPGCGKTRYAWALADAFGQPEPITCTIKSTTRARDLLYTFDAVKRLYGAQMKDLKEPAEYVTLGPLGKAIEEAGKPETATRSVVLLDEVDKADLDFPNDLLHELDRLSFTVAETGQPFAVPPSSPHLRPLVVLTHNDEKPLPAPFLRRCISFEITFPSEAQLQEILTTWGHAPEAPLTRAALEVLARLRQPGLDLSRAPGLSEFLDWLQFAKYVKAKPEELHILAYGEALLKTAQDRQKARQALEKPSA